VNPIGRKEDEQELSQALRSSMRVDGARAGMVNRTHRVVREQALTMQEQKRKSRSLWVRLLIFSFLMLVICYAIWGVLDGYDLTPNGIPDASDQMMILLLWSLPVTAVLLGLVWIKRGRNRVGSNSEAQ
jgi:TRAP-type C4-dicarboxylate transport system permease small subunit